MSILAAHAATAALGFLMGRLGTRPEFRKLRSENAHLRELVDNLDAELRLATYMAGHDRLTGLPNRSSATKIFLVREMRGLPTLVAVIDLDRFKHINDTYGHHVGDDLLRVIAERLIQAVKPHGGIAARLAGDEFLLLLPAAEDTDPAKAVTAILDLLAQPVTLSTDDGEVVAHPEASAGIAIYDGRYGTFDTMLHHADVALYHAKQQRGTHRTYEPHMRMPRNASRHGPRRRDQRPADGDTQTGGQVTR